MSNEIAYHFVLSLLRAVYWSALYAVWALTGSKRLSLMLYVAGLGIIGLRALLGSMPRRRSVGRISIERLPSADLE